MSEEQRIRDGVLFKPGDPELKAIKLRSHKLSAAFSKTTEDETEYRNELMHQILGDCGEGCFMQGPVFFHYGKHTHVGNRLFANYNLTVQDDAEVFIGDDVNFGPNTTIVTPVHPMLPDERNQMLDQNGKPARLCYAKPVHIGSNIWFGACVTVCPGVTIGDNCVIGAGSVVTRDIPANSFAAGVPAKVIRPITEEDSMKYKPEILGGCSVIEK